jgi:aspartate oxidase
MNIRAQAVGMASQTQNIANLIVNQFFPTFLTVSSKSQPFASNIV